VNDNATGFSLGPERLEALRASGGAGGPGPAMEGAHQIARRTGVPRPAATSAAPRPTASSAAPRPAASSAIPRPAVPPGTTDHPINPHDIVDYPRPKDGLPEITATPTQLNRAAQLPAAGRGRHPMLPGDGDGPSGCHQISGLIWLCRSSSRLLLGSAGV